MPEYMHPLLYYLECSLLCMHIQQPARGSSYRRLLTMPCHVLKHRV